MLLRAALRARVVEFYQRFPLEQQARALQLGLEACEIAIDLATQLGDLPCVAVFQAVKGTGLYCACDLNAARAAYADALALRRQLVRERPQVYEPNVAGTLHNLGNVLLDLRELEQARVVYAEALALRRRLVQQQPQVYTPDMAMTLITMGDVLRDLREFTQARAAYA